MQHIQYLRFEQVSNLTGLSKATIDRLERSGKFPKRRKIGTRAIGWVHKEVDVWLREKLNATQAKRGNP